MPLPAFLCRPQLFAAFIGMVLCVSSYAADWALPDLMHLLAQNKSGKASFTEKKYIGILDSSIEDSVYYMA